MTITEAIDILLIHVYKKNNNFCQVSDLIDINSINLNLLNQKLENLNYFDLNSPASEEIGVMEIFIYPNIHGAEFVEKHETYSNFLLKSKAQQENEQKVNENKDKWAILASIGSYGGLFVNIIAALFTIIFGVYSCQKDDKIKTLELKNDSLNVILGTKSKLLEQLQHKSENPKQTNDTLKRNTNQAL